MASSRRSKPESTPTGLIHLKPPRLARSKPSTASLRASTRVAMNEVVGRLGRVEQLGCDLAAANGQRAVEQPGLDEDGGLVPINVLMGDLAAVELNDRDDRHFH